MQAYDTQEKKLRVNFHYTQNVLKKRLNFKKEVYEKLKKLQLPLEFKKKKSHYIIKNDFKPLTIKKSVKILKEKIFKNETNSFRY